MNDVIHIRVLPETKRQIEVIAAQRGRTVSEYGREVLTSEIRNQDIIEILEQQNKYLSWILGYAISGSIALEEFIKQPKDDKGRELNSLELSRQLKGRVAERMASMFKKIHSEIIGEIGDGDE